MKSLLFILAILSTVLADARDGDPRSPCLPDADPTIGLQHFCRCADGACYWKWPGIGGCDPPGDMEIICPYVTNTWPCWAMMDPYETGVGFLDTLQRCDDADGMHAPFAWNPEHAPPERGHEFNGRQYKHSPEWMGWPKGALPPVPHVEKVAPEPM